MPLITELTQVDSYTPFSQQVTISAGITGETINSITVTKLPSSINGSGTSLAYDNLWLTFGSGTSQNFIVTDTLTTTGVGNSTINITFTGTYTDYMFPRTMKYYNNPNNIEVNIETATTVNSISVNRTISNEAANPRINSYTTKQVTPNTITTTDNRSQFYHTVNSWVQVPDPVDALYYFQPYTGAPLPYFTYQISISYSNDDLIYGSIGGSGTSSFTLTHVVNYNLAHDQQIFNERLSSQRFGGPPF